MLQRPSEGTEPQGLYKLGTLIGYRQAFAVRFLMTGICGIPLEEGCTIFTSSLLSGRFSTSNIIEIEPKLTLMSVNQRHE